LCSPVLEFFEGQHTVVVCISLMVALRCRRRGHFLRARAAYLERGRVGERLEDTREVPGELGEVEDAIAVEVVLRNINGQRRATQQDQN
jgi:hypothetical protein